MEVHVLFEGYAVTVLSPVQRAYGMANRTQAPADSNARFGAGSSR